MVRYPDDSDDGMPGALVPGLKAEPPSKVGKYVAFALVLLLGLGGWWVATNMSWSHWESKYRWFTQRWKADQAAKIHGHPLVVVTMDPDDEECVRFQRQVIEATEVLDIADGYTWCMIRVKRKDEEDAERVIPRLFIMSKDGERKLAETDDARQLSGSELKGMLVAAKRGG